MSVRRSESSSKASGRPREPLLPVGFVWHPTFLQHDTGLGHPESPHRLQAILQHLKSTGLWETLRISLAEPASRDTIELVHPRAYLEALEVSCRQGPMALDPDTIVSPGSWEAALRAVGAVTQAIDAVIRHEARAVFCAVRPPGHHALMDRAMGFCLLNNVAIGARYAQTRHHLTRVLIVDWDVHHGNGTQAIFAEDPTVLYVSTHQFPFYPGTGSRQECGVGRGVGATVNVPLPVGSGNEAIIEAFQCELLPRALAFKPELVLISAGFDAHRDDPLAGLQVTEAGYTALTKIVLEITDTCCPGRLVSVLEGGYDLNALPRSVEAHLRALGVTSS